MEPLDGRRVRLRAIEPEDEDILFRWENDQKFWQVSNTLAPWSRHILRQYLEQAHLDIFQTKQLRLVIEVLEPTRPVGLIDLFDFDPLHLRAGVGILIGEPDEWGKGYAREALRLLIDYAFSVLLLNQLYCSIDESNTTSLHLFRNAGFRVTGIREKWNRVPGGWLNEWFLQYTGDDWLSSREKEGMEARKE